MRWLRLAIYSGVLFLTLFLALPRLRVLFALVRGPYGWVADPPHPWLWPAIFVVAVVYAGALLADVGLGLLRTPRWLHATLMGAFIAAVLGAVYDPAPGRRTPAEIHEAAPQVQVDYVLDQAEAALRAYYKQHERFPTEPEVLQQALVDEVGAPLLGVWRRRWLARVPWVVEVFPKAKGPITRVPAGTPPGTLLYAVDAARRRYWLTAVSGEGAPTRPCIAAGPNGSPLVRTNAPTGGLFR
ncbi:MAG: hypothetical protein D6729_16320 [Deltaproteobacteria bacterium]|nr:MAG: hypothetical protein D6729_16320 [Deltaproteobacteria bacterium]